MSVSTFHSSGVSNLAAHFAIERSPVEDELKHFPVLLNHGPVLKKLCALHGNAVVTRELHVFALVVNGPVTEAVGGGVAGTVLLFLELHVEALEVDCITLL